MELYGFMEREKKIPSYFFIITIMELNLKRTLTCIILTVLTTLSTHAQTLCVIDGTPLSRLPPARHHRRDAVGFG